MTEVFHARHFTGKETSKLDFDDAVFVNCTFEDCEHTPAAPSYTVFVNCVFQRVDFYWAVLFMTRFIGCELEEVDFRGAGLTEVVFSQCKLTRCDFSHDNLGGDTSLDSVLFHDTERIDCKYKKFVRV